MIEDPKVRYAATIRGHDGIPDGEWQYTYYFPLNPYDSPHGYRFSPRAREEVVCRDYERLIGKANVEKHILPSFEGGESHFFPFDEEGLTFTCPETDCRFERIHRLSLVDFQIDFVLEVPEQDGSQFFRLIPFK